MTSSNPMQANDEFVLKLFCTEQEDALRVYVDAPRMPAFLRACFDEDGEAFPVWLDFDDLDRFMAKRGAEFEKTLSKHGDVQLAARGKAALDLSQWLAAAFQSCFRDTDGAPRQNVRQG